MLEAIAQTAASLSADRFLDWLGPRLSNRYLDRLLSFSPGELLFVLPHREREPTAVLPRVALEDVLAMRNILEVLKKSRWQGSIGVRDVSNLSDSDKKRNIVTLGGPEANPFSQEILNCLPPSECLKFEPDPSCNTQWIIRRGQITTYRSESYAVPDGSSPETERSDVGIIVKTKNPHNDASTVLAVAGVRGVGTWGAADYIRKKSREIYRRKRRGKGLRKDGAFAIVLVAYYKSFDIKGAEIRDFVDLS